jgi:lysozyme
VREGLVWSSGQVLDALSKDVAKAEECINAKVKVTLTQNQFDALCSFIFNVGVGAFSKSTMLKLINLGFYAEAGKQFDRWVIPPEIRLRRMSEKTQFVGV